MVDAVPPLANPWRALIAASVEPQQLASYQSWLALGLGLGLGSGLVLGLALGLVLGSLESPGSL